MIKHFPALLKYKDLVFCDNAGGTQLPIQVITRVNNMMSNNYVQPFYNNILSRELKYDLTNVEDITRTILNANTGNIVYGNSATQLIYTLANSMIINSNDTVILTEFAHLSMISPFIRRFNNVDYWLFSDTYTIEYNKLLDKVDKTTKLVVLPHVSNILGNIIDIEYLSNMIKQKNNQTKILVDGVAYMPHGLIDIDKYNIDYYVVSFYKFYGLRISALYITSNELRQLVNQNNNIFNKDSYKTSTNKLQPGGINYETAISILGIRDYLLDHYSEYKNIDRSSLVFTREIFKNIIRLNKKYETTLIDIFRNGLEYNREIEIIEDINHEKVPIFALKFKNYNVKNINIVLNNLGILSNVGTFYCDYLLDNICANKNQPSEVLRISLASYNTMESIKQITHILNLFTKKHSLFDFEKLNALDICSLDYTMLQYSFNNLQPDKYYTTERYRAFSMLNIDNIDNIKIVGNMGFYQSQNYNSYNGDVYREYNNIDPDIVQNLVFKYYVNKFKDKIILEYAYIPEYINVHQIRVVFDKSENTSTVVPEGIHRDGYNIIMIICITRYNIKGGANNIYDNSKNIIFSTILKNSEAIIINDNALLHDVSSIISDNQQIESYRDVFVLTSIC